MHRSAIGFITITLCLLALAARSLATYQVERRARSEHATKQMGCAVAFAELP